MCSSRVSKPTGICGSGKNSAVYFLPEVALACPAASAALILVTLKHSKTSPTLTSLKLATPAPHSKRSEEHTSELQSLTNLVCRLLLEKKKKKLKIKPHSRKCTISSKSEIQVK